MDCNNNLRLHLNIEKPKAIFKNAWPYQRDAMNLPVADVAVSIPFYQTVFDFKLLSQVDTPVKSAVLGRDEIKIGIAENGGDPTQDGCFFEVDNAERAFAELKANGLEKEVSDFSTQKHGETTWKVFFVVAPDGLCYCLGEKQPAAQE
jgi:catechol 2,3-dioxygenase-like lactoylglutathione lyase family enzyme